MNAGAAQELLLHVRELVASGDFAAVARAIEPVETGQLLGEPELGYHAAYAWRRLGRTTEALNLAIALDVPVRRKAEARLIRRRLNLEAMLCYDLGEIQRAEDLWQQVVEAASRDGDFVLLSAAHNNLGVLHTLRDRTPDALATYTRALAAARQNGDVRGIAQAHQNLGILYRETAHRSVSDEHFRAAISFARESRSIDVIGRAEEERAILLLDRGDTEMARASAEQARRRLDGIADVGGVGEALRVLGIIALRGREPEAEQLLAEALSCARRVNNPLLEAEAREALAVLAERRGEMQSADELRADASALFTRMSAEPWGLRIRRRTRELAGAG